MELDTKKSIVRNSLDCGTIQGSKLSGFLFNVYSNEIPLLHKLINTEIYYKMGGKKINLKNISHDTTNFVDDSHSIIGFKDHEKIKIYLEQYFNLLIQFYNINRVKLNTNKTNLMIVSKRKNYNFFKNFTFEAGTDTICNQNSIKILGTIVQNDLNLDKGMNKLTATLHNRIFHIRKVSKFTKFGTRLKF